ncbi:MAG: lipocalin family protein [Aeromonas sp.]
MRMWFLLLSALGLSACSGLPPKAQAVTPFDLSRYAGTWHEIARLDHAFERGLSAVTATYRPRADGGVTVINRGRTADGQWRSAEGKAYLAGAPQEGRLKVSFFGPFYAAYNILALDANYQLALVSSHNLDYLWILSRSPTPAAAAVNALVAQAHTLGFATSQLIWLHPVAD